MPTSPRSNKSLRTWRAAVVLAVGLSSLASCRWARNVPPASHSGEPASMAVETRLREEVRAATGDPRPRLELIQYLTTTGRHNDALDAAREAHVQFPDSGPVRAVLAQSLANTARYPEALEVYRPLAAISPAYAVEFASTLMRAGREREAGAVISRLPVVRGGLALRAAQVALDALRPDVAVKLLGRKDPDAQPSPEVSTHLGLALMLDGRYAQAAKELARAADMAPPPAALHYYLGTALRLSGSAARLKEAEEHLAQAAELEPGNPALQYELGLAHAQLRDWKSARVALEEAGRLGGGVPEIQRDLARVRARTGDNTGAALARSLYRWAVADGPGGVRELEPVYRRDPTNTKVALAMAEAYYDARRYTETREILYSLRKREPRNPDVLWALARAERAMEHNKEALQALDDLAALSPGDLMVLRQRAEILRRVSRLTEVEQLATQLRDREPLNPVRHYELGQFLALYSQRADRLPLAEASLRKAAELDPTLAAAHYQLAQLFMNARRTREAVDEARRALDLEPANLDALRLLGQLYKTAGEARNSEDTFRLFRRLNATASELKRLELPSTLERATPAEHVALARAYLRSSRRAEAIRELEAADAATSSLEPAARQLLASLYGHGRRFQRQFEVRGAAHGAAFGDAR